MGKFFNRLADRWRHPKRDIMAFAVMVLWNPHTGGFSLIDPLTQRRLWQLSANSTSLGEGEAPSVVSSSFVPVKPGKTIRLGQRDNAVHVTSRPLIGPMGETRELVRIEGALPKPVIYTRVFNAEGFSNSELLVDGRSRTYHPSRTHDSSRYVNWLKRKLQQLTAG